MPLGACHTPSVIYYPALTANLEIVERHNHTYAVGYVPDRMDATVWYRDGSTWKQCTVWYRNGGSWVQVVPYYRNGGTWIRV